MICLVGPTSLERQAVFDEWIARLSWRWSFARQGCITGYRRIRQGICGGGEGGKGRSRRWYLGRRYRGGWQVQV